MVELLPNKEWSIYDRLYWCGNILLKCLLLTQFRIDFPLKINLTPLATPVQLLVDGINTRRVSELDRLMIIESKQVWPSANAIVANAISGKVIESGLNPLKTDAKIKADLTSENSLKRKRETESDATDDDKINEDFEDSKDAKPSGFSHRT